VSERALVAVDLTAPTPPYEQIRAQVAGHVATGGLRAGDRLPTVRALAADLGVANGTVARAYRELEAAGVVVSRRRTGTVVAEGARGREDADLRGLATDLAERARADGLDDERVVDLVRGALAALPRAARADTMRR
jgi:GntR family transcriptional regulator